VVVGALVEPVPVVPVVLVLVVLVELVVEVLLVDGGDVVVSSSAIID